MAHGEMTQTAEVRHTAVDMFDSKQIGNINEHINEAGPLPRQPSHAPSRPRGPRYK